MISVLMGAHRLDEHLFISIDSILNQTFISFELIIIANGVNAKSIIDEINSRYDDDRILLIHSPVGQLASALNIGLSAAKYELIARMDSDCVSREDRLEKQYDFITSNKFDLIGSKVRLIDEKGNVIQDTTAIRKGLTWHLLFSGGGFPHPTIMCKKQLLLDMRGYSGGFNSEDKDLWLRLWRQGNVQWSIMDDTFVDYRVQADGTAQSTKLAYAEGAGYFMRELLLTKNPFFIFAILLSIIKFYVKGK